MTKRLLMQILAGMPDDVEIEAQNSKGEEFTFTNEFHFYTKTDDTPAIVTIYFE